ncbi:MULTISPECIES: ABC transporter permease [unclassified Nonomuraea]|uniref:ABC transporter permease n=1 Tax=unclassified Nonomuraea TaxID=2593643 RepID=UPI0033ECD870
MSPARTRPATALGGRRRLGAFVFLTPGLAYLVVLLLVPLALVLSYVFFQRGRFGGVVYEFTTENFSRLIDPLYLRVLGESLEIAALATLIALALGYPTAYLIARLPRKWKTVALVAIVLPFWTNFIIRMYAWIILLNGPGLVNSALKSFGLGPFELLYTKGAIVVGLVYSYLPLMVLPLYAAIEKLDPQLREASANLGASRLTTFRKVTLPLTVPGVMTGCLFVFVPSFGNFVIPEMLGGGKSVMVGNLIRTEFLKARDWPFGSALTLALVAVLVVLLLVQAWAARRA